MHLSLYRPDGTTKTYPELLPMIAMYPDGVLLRDWSVYFVPLRDGELDMQKKVEVTPVPDWITLRSALPRAYKPYPWEADFRSVLPLRHSDTFAWLGEAALKGEVGLMAFNLQTGERSLLNRLRGPNPYQNIDAFDGESLVRGQYVYGPAPGECVHLPAQLLPDGSHFTPIVIAVRHRVGYCFARGHLVAVDMTGSNNNSRDLTEAKNGPFAETDKGLVVWTGTKWITVPWITKW